MQRRELREEPLDVHLVRQYRRVQVFVRFILERVDDETETKSLFPRGGLPRLVQLVLFLVLSGGSTSPDAAEHAALPTRTDTTTATTTAPLYSLLSLWLVPSEL